MLLAPLASGWQPSGRQPLPRHSRHRVRTTSPLALDSAPLPAVSLAAGMVAGAIGVGVAYPLDTLKTKMQACGGGSPWETARRVLATDGPSGFYGGVASTMLGQAVIKGVRLEVAVFVVSRRGLRMTARTLPVGALLRV